ncbi:cell wall hydrolase [Halalkalibacter oceani]|uniref:cell wall hydrolase n=1 Tax=Halalkalibacter oceani TaxID=1653776 RepID=UPI0033943FB9
MKKMITIVGITAALLCTGGLATAAAGVHTVQTGDTLYKVGQTYGVSVEALKQVNGKSSSVLYPGEQLTLPASISQADKDLLARLVTAEAKGEPYAGMVAVATVVLNRVDHHDFPNTIRGVIEEVTPTGHYAFSPVKDGNINQPATEQAKRAVNEALAFHGQGQGSLYFYNPAKATNHWNATRTETIRIGDHVFAK